MASFISASLLSKSRALSRVIYVSLISKVTPVRSSQSNFLSGEGKFHLYLISGFSRGERPASHSVRFYSQIECVGDRELPQPVCT